MGVKQSLIPLMVITSFFYAAETVSAIDLFSYQPVAGAGIYMITAVIIGALNTGLYTRHRNSLTWEKLQKKWTEKKQEWVQKEITTGPEINVKSITGNPENFIGKHVTLSGYMEFSSESGGLVWYIFRDKSGSMPAYSRIRTYSGKGSLTGVIERTRYGQVYIQVVRFSEA